jgi:hypothetical protein
MNLKHSCKVNCVNKTREISAFEDYQKRNHRNNHFLEHDKIIWERRKSVASDPNFVKIIEINVEFVQ